MLQNATSEPSSLIFLSISLSCSCCSFDLRGYTLVFKRPVAYCIGLHEPSRAPCVWRIKNPERWTLNWKCRINQLFLLIVKRRAPASTTTSALGKPVGAASAAVCADEMSDSTVSLRTIFENSGEVSQGSTCCVLMAYTASAFFSFTGTEKLMLLKHYREKSWCSRFISRLCSVDFMTLSRKK